MENPQLALAFEYVRFTNKNIFLTGKAGTGKTTFLHAVKKETTKRTVVVAPTGVAAINAGGVTIHSFFQLPFGPIVPGATQDPIKQRKFTREKIRLIQSLDLLIIDEISMVRADLLDGIDEVLRRFKDHYKPFGGVQLLMIGDLHQLPPVVKDDDWLLLREHYQTAYFFGSQALRKTNPVTIELRHIYRQSDETFIALLNKVRDNQVDTQVLATLNNRYVPNFSPPEEDSYITLSSHNASAIEINTRRLAALSGDIYKFKAEVEGDFPEFSYPNEQNLDFKINAQVMFVKNDLSREKLWYNGKIGKIARIEDGTIYVRCPGEAFDIPVNRVEWQNLKFTLNESSKEVEEEVLGTFRQYPLKLAWAITIHKSQGLTFERAVIDANAAFAHGQVYVALSRCKSFEGIVLSSQIGPSSIRTDSTVKNYSDEAARNAPDEQHLHRSKIEFQQALLLELFDFSNTKRLVERISRVMLEHENALQPGLHPQFQAIASELREHVFDIGAKFVPQIPGYFAERISSDANAALQERLKKAGTYFVERLQGIALSPLKNIQIETDNKSVLKSAEEALEALEKEAFVKNACFAALQNGFDLASYQRVRANAELDFQTAKKAKSASGETQAATSAGPPLSEHPELYIALKKWRNDLAIEMGLDPFQIMHNRVLREIIEKLPTGLPELKKIKGVGAVKSGQFGAAIVEIVRDYCTRKRLVATDLFKTDK